MGTCKQYIPKHRKQPRTSLKLYLHWAGITCVIVSAAVKKLQGCCTLPIWSIQIIHLAETVIQIKLLKRFVQKRQQEKYASQEVSRLLRKAGQRSRWDALATFIQDWQPKNMDSALCMNRKISCLEVYQISRDYKFNPFQAKDPFVDKETELIYKIEACIYC